MTNLDSLTIAVAGTATIGLVTSVQVITSWLRKLFNLDGNDVRWLATVVALYIVAMYGLTQSSWRVWGTDVADAAAWGGVGAYLVAMIAASASALNDQLKQ